MFDKVTLKLNVDPLILGALKEDITSEDVSTNSVMPEPKLGEVELICKQDGIICGLQVFARTFELLDEDVEITFFAKDGDEVKKGQKMAVVRGDIRVLLCGERTALNYLQRMSGIATYTNGVAKLLAGTKTKLLDTRKTSPNNRIFEKYAVRIGGGNNHRYNLTDGVLLKDNHIGAAGGVKQAVTMAKEYAPFVRKIEVEVENLSMVREAVEAGADIIMLDNMSHDVMKEAIDIIDGKAEIEVSGNVTRENIAKLNNIRLMDSDDISKIILICDDGKYLYDRLLDEYKVQLEMASFKYVIAMTSVADKQEYYDRFLSALKEIDESWKVESKDSENDVGESLGYAINNKPEVCMCPSDAIDLMDENGYEDLSVNSPDICGRISMSSVLIYPPGMPVVNVGERITGDVCRIIKSAINAGLEVPGLKEGKIRCLR